jgi:hypothetical protein
MSVTEPVNSCPVDVNESSLAVVVVAVSTDGGAGVIASSPMNVMSARVARRSAQSTHCGKGQYCSSVQKVQQY